MTSRIQLLIAALLFSTGGVVMKSCALNGWQIAAGRCMLATIPMLVFLPEARRRWTWRVCLVGIVYGGMLLCYVLANKTTTAASAVFLQSTAPLYLCFLAPWLLGEKLRRHDPLIMAFVALGLGLLIVGPPEASLTAPNPAAGNWIGALAGLLWALTLLGLRQLEASEEEPGAAVRAVVAGNLIVGILLLPIALPVESASSMDWWLLLYLGAFQVALAYIFLTRAITQVPALEASLLLLAEPVFSPLWAWWMHREDPGMVALIGGALILMAGTSKSWLDLRSNT